MIEEVYTLENIDANSEAVDSPILLFKKGDHAIYWLGINEETAFRCNVYLIKDGEKGILVDPGGRQTFQYIHNRLMQVMLPQHVIGMILCHQDPDVAGSMLEWLAINPTMRVFSTPRTHVLLPHYGKKDYSAYNVEQSPQFTFANGSTLVFYPAPFLHSPGAFVTFDTESGYLFSGDIWAALDTDWQLKISSFEHHVPKMGLFNKDYMASQIATRGFIQSINGLDIQAILPQHGSLIGNIYVSLALDYLDNLVCGLDLIYADSNIDATEPMPQEGGRESKMQNESAILRMPMEHLEVTEESQQREAHLLREALEQSARLASLRDKALHDLQAAKRRMHESQTRLFEAQRIAHIGHWDWDISNNNLIWSDEIYRIFGLGPQEFPLTYACFLNRVHPDDRDLVDESVQYALKGKRAYNLDHRIVLPDGTVRVVHEQAQVTLNDAGQPVRMLGTVHDITERKRTEEILQQNNVLIESIKRMQSHFISQGDPFQMYSKLLNDLLILSASEYGFVSEVLESAEGDPYLKIYALTNLAWNEETQKLYDAVRQKGFEFHKLDSLYGQVIVSGQPVISNDPARDPRRGGFPEGHPLIDSFLGIPVHIGKRLVGVIGLANRKSGYEQSLVDYMEPMVAACGQIIVARQDQVARQQAEEALSKLASLDGLLGIPNRRRFEEYLQQEWRRGWRSESPLSIIMIDIDHFKRYNDHYGHQGGDDCLIQIANIITGSLRRPSDMVARYGGEELVCVLPETSLQSAVLLAKNIRERLIDNAIPHVASPVADLVTISMGIATMVPTAENTSNALLSLADEYLYKAKSGGRDQIVTTDGALT